MKERAEDLKVDTEHEAPLTEGGSGQREDDTSLAVAPGVANGAKVP